MSKMDYDLTLKAKLGLVKLLNQENIESATLNLNRRKNVQFEYLSRLHEMW